MSILNISEIIYQKLDDVKLAILSYLHKIPKIVNINNNVLPSVVSIHLCINMYCYSGLLLF